MRDGLGGTVAVERAVLGIIDCGLHAAVAAILAVGVSAARRPPVAFLAANRTAHRHPEACLGRGTRLCAVAARARGVAVGLPDVGRLPGAPLGELAVDSVPRFGLDEAAVGCREGDEESHEVQRVERLGGPADRYQQPQAGA